MGDREWRMWNNEEDDEAGEEDVCYGRDPQYTNFNGLVANSTEELTCGRGSYDETPYFTPAPSPSPSPSLLSFTSCTSSLEMDAGEGERHLFCNDRKVGDENDDENGGPYNPEFSVTQQPQPQSQEKEYMDKNSMKHDATGTKTEDENVEKGDDNEFDSAKGEGEGEEQALDIDIFKNPLFFLPPEEEQEYLEEEEEEEEEGLPRSSTDVLSSSSSSTKEEEKEKEMVNERQRKRAAMKAVVDVHFRFLVEQFVAAEKLSAEKWKDIICSLSWEAASFIKPDASREGKAMDPGGYVKVKCVACGQPTQSKVIKGVVLKKNVAHKHMPTRYKNPRLLLLGGALEYDRASNQLSSFDTLLQQEIDFLRLAVAKIEAHHPNVLLVEKTVSRHARDCLLAKEISLVLDVNKSHLEHIAQCTGAQIVSSLDNLTPQNVKYCELFHVEKFVEEHGSAGEACKKLTKTLMFFEGCPKPLGCTILLKGASRDELKKAKRVVQYAVFAAYHLVLEISFLADERAIFLETPSHYAENVGKPSKRASSETSICTIPSFVDPVLDETYAGEVKKENKDDKCLTISPLLSSDFLKNIEEASKPISPTGPFKTKQCVSMPSARTFCPSNEMIHQQDTNAIYHGFMVPSVSLCHLMSGLSDYIKQDLGKALPVIVTESYATNNSYLSIKDTEFKASTEGDVSTFSVTSGIYDCGKASEEAPGKVRLENEGITDIQDDFSSLESQPKIEHKYQDSTHYEEQGFSKEGLATSLSDHQSILVSLSKRCILKGTVCEHSHLSRINYYGSCDKSLGRFLRERLFDQSSHCHACDQPPTAHAYCYTHQKGRLTIYVQQLPCDLVLPREGEGKIWMWHRCLRCAWKDGTPQGNKRVVMSDAASVLSFGKFLELSFLNRAAANTVPSCGHSLHRDCLRFYGLGNMVACFHYSAISVFGVRLPPKIVFNDSNQQEWLRKELAEVTEMGEKFFSEISHLIHGIKLKVTCELRNLLRSEEMLQKEREEFEESLQKSITKNWQPGQPSADILELNRLRRQLLFESYVWECRLHLLYSSVEVERSSVTSVSNLHDLNSSVEKENMRLEKLGSHMADNHDRIVSVSEILYMHGDGCVVNSEYIDIEKAKVCSEEVIVNEVGWSVSMPCSLQDSNLVDQLTEVPRAYDKPVDLMVNTKEPIINLNTPGQEMTSRSASSKGFTSEKMSGNQSVGLAGSRDDLSLLEDDLEVHRPSSEGHSSDVSDLSDTFDAGWTGDHLLASQASHKISDSVGVNELPFEVVCNLVQRSPIQSVVRIKSSDSSLNMQDKGVLETHVNMPSLPVKSFDLLEDLIWHPFSCLHVVFSKASPEILCKLISQCTPPVLQNSAFKLFGQGGARLSLPAGINNIVIPVYDDEPTSLIAYALSSKQYWVQMSDDILEEKQRDEHEDIQKEVGDSSGTDVIVSRLLQYLDVSSDVSEVASEARSASSGNASTSGSYGTADADPLLHTKVIHVEISFGDVNQLGKVKYSVICYHAKKFSALRKICCRTEMEFIRSLSRCKKWRAQGGKSRVFFAKTLDDRFIIKQVTKTELESFLQFAPEYFKHLTHSLSTGSPSCLSKVLGVYQVTVKHSKGGKDSKMDLMVMENLMFGKTVARQYDLKGSLRNRYNPDSSGVLLDQNFIEAMLTSPIFVGTKAKNHLVRAVWNDTYFLNSINVMDYSLLVGVDEEQRELVLGIIDFMRQYTWDKHLETRVKASGILGGPKNELPTVISPMEYKKRFRKAISTYFQTVPDP